MSNFVKFALEDGTIVYLETTDTPRGTSGFPLSGRGDHPAEQEAVSFENSIQSIRKMAETLVQDIREGFTQSPDEIQVNFGLKASAEVGALVVSRGGMEANYNVMLRWRSEEKKEEKGEKESPEAEKK